MALLRLVGSLIVALLVQGCVGHRGHLDLAAGRDDELSAYVAELTPLEQSRRTRSHLWIRPTGMEEFIDVTRTADEYWVFVTFCPEEREAQERQLLESVGPLPHDMIAGTSVGETRCSYGRSFRFASPSDTAEFLRNVLRVLGAASFQYSVSYTAVK